MVVRLDCGVHDELIAYARGQLPREAVGLLWGERGRVSAWSPMRNVAAGCAAFQMDADEFKIALSLSSFPLLAVMHSHPTEPPIPSSHDFLGATAWRSVVHLILSLADGAARFRAWRLFDGQALPVPLHIFEEGPAAFPSETNSLSATGSRVRDGLPAQEGTVPWI